MMYFIYVTVIIQYPCVSRCIILRLTLKKIVKKGVVIQQGIVKLVCFVLRKNSPKEAFSNIIIPLTKIAEYYLLLLPVGLFEHKLPGAGSFFDRECSYLSLNIYFDDHS